MVGFVNHVPRVLFLSVGIVDFEGYLQVVRIPYLLDCHESAHHEEAVMALRHGPWRPDQIHVMMHLVLPSEVEKLSRF